MTIETTILHNGPHFDFDSIFEKISEKFEFALLIAASCLAAYPSEKLSREIQDAIEEIRTY